jgi:hypothetical protein
VTEEAAESSEPDTSEEPVAPPPGVGIQSYPGGWHLVEKGSWQVSVSPDGMIMLPRHLHPLEIADFCAAASGAAKVAEIVIRNNDKKNTPAPTLEELQQIGTVIVTERGADEPQGAARMISTPRVAQERAATIGRPRASRRDPREPFIPPSPQPPNSGGRRGNQQRY